MKHANKIFKIKNIYRRKLSRRHDREVKEQVKSGKEKRLYWNLKKKEKREEREEREERGNEEKKESEEEEGSERKGRNVGVDNKQSVHLIKGTIQPAARDMLIRLWYIRLMSGWESRILRTPRCQRLHLLLFNWRLAPHCVVVIGIKGYFSCRLPCKLGFYGRSYLLALVFDVSSWR